MMTVTQANHVNVLCNFLLGPLNAYERRVTEGEVREALAELAAQANKCLSAGWMADDVRNRWGRIANIGHARKPAKGTTA
jgi:hypothetical protein